ncbi:uncharacterized protein [Procambarus clarkii]|uniref:uncharacterized protein n=1 Tax=Procambarus clarkii TaxID=6728 RepID=UPI0037444161
MCSYSCILLLWTTLVVSRVLVVAQISTVVQTPVDDRVALQTTVVVRPKTLTVTNVQSDFRIVTEKSLDYVTIAHTSLSYTTTLVRTNVNTKSTVFTDYLTVTDTVLVPGARYVYRQP